MPEKDVIVIALGGNALIQKGQTGTKEEQLSNLRRPMKQIAGLSRERNIVITHGNGPQVGFLLEQQKTLHNGKVPRMPLDVLVAETQGQIGYMIETVLDEELTGLGTADDLFFLTMLSYVKVDENDPAFQNPTKPVGPFYTWKELLENLTGASFEMQEIEGWSTEGAGKILSEYGIEVEGNGETVRKGSEVYRRMQSNGGGNVGEALYRKVVPSPVPQKIYQYGEILKIIRQQRDFIIITCGGGGIPVIVEKTGKNKKVVKGIEAVIDKDLASSRLAIDIRADMLVIATNVEKVALNFGTPEQKDMDIITVDEAKRYLREGQFGEGSMAPKIQGSINFIESGKGKRAIITSIDKIVEAIHGKAGTQIVP